MSGSDSLHAEEVMMHLHTSGESYELGPNSYSEAKAHVHKSWRGIYLARLCCYLHNIYPSPRIYLNMLLMDKG